jgi:hypothetical protein
MAYKDLKKHRDMKDFDATLKGGGGINRFSSALSKLSAMI